MISISVTQLEKTNNTCRLLYLQSIQYSPPLFPPEEKKHF